MVGRESQTSFRKIYKRLTRHYNSTSINQCKLRSFLVLLTLIPFYLLLTFTFPSTTQQHQSLHRTSALQCTNTLPPQLSSPSSLRNLAVKPLIVILSCKMHAHLWPELLKKSPDTIIFMCNPDLNTEYSLDNRILSLKCEDTYDHLPTKVYQMITSILSISEFESITHVFKIDDHDTVFDSDTIGKLSLVLKNRKMDYCGQNINFMGERLNSYHIVGNAFTTSKVDNTWHYNKSPKTSRWYNAPYLGDYAPWIDGGCGYVLSRKAMRLIECTYKGRMDEIYQHYIYEDLMVALILRKYNIYPQRIDAIIVGDKTDN